MIIYAKCAVCDMSTLNDEFLKRAPDERDAGNPVYWASKQFHPELTENIVFCSASHSLEWHEQQKKLKSEQQNNTI